MINSPAFSMRRWLQPQILWTIQPKQIVLLQLLELEQCIIFLTLITKIVTCLSSGLPSCEEKRQYRLLPPPHLGNDACEKKYSATELSLFQVAPTMPQERQQMIENNMGVLLQVQCTPTSMQTTATVLSAHKSRPREQIKGLHQVCLLSLSATNWGKMVKSAVPLLCEASIDFAEVKSRQVHIFSNARSGP